MNASACPALQQRGVFLRIADAPTATNGNAPCAPNMTVGNGSNFRYDTVRPIATTIDKVASAGGSNTACIVGSSNLGSELQIVAPGSGLILTVRAGDAIIGGYCEIPNDRTIAVPDATARVWIWLQQDKTLTYTITTTPPTTLSVLLGSCVTSAGNITAVDRSAWRGAGQVYRRSGRPDRLAAAEREVLRDHSVLFLRVGRRGLSASLYAFRDGGPDKRSGRAGMVPIRQPADLHLYGRICPALQRGGRRRKWCCGIDRG